MTNATGTDLHTLLINRRTTKGYNAAQSATMLSELIAAHDGDNLAHALVYNGFIDARRADKVVARLASL